MSEPAGDDPSRFLRTELLERIAHEVRGPAGVIGGALDELEHALGPEVVQQNRALFAMARRGVRRVLRTAERLARTAALEAPGSPVQRVPSDVRTAVRDAAEDAQKIEGRASIALQLSMPSGPCTAAIDAGWLSVALSEVIGQAIRTARHQVQVAVEEAPGRVLVSVRDDRAAVAAPASERFVRIEDRRDAGLSWPLVWDVARAHEAELRWEPLQAGDSVQGLRLTLELPSAD